MGDRIRSSKSPVFGRAVRNAGKCVWIGIWTRGSCPADEPTRLHTRYERRTIGVAIWTKMMRSFIEMGSLHGLLAGVHPGRCCCTELRAAYSQASCKKNFADNMASVWLVPAGVAIAVKGLAYNRALPSRMSTPFSRWSCVTDCWHCEPEMPLLRECRPANCNFAGHESQATIARRACRKPVEANLSLPHLSPHRAHAV